MNGLCKLLLVVAAPLWAAPVAHAEPAFAPARSIATAAAPMIALADVDRDGRPDIVVSSLSEDTVTILLTRPGGAPDVVGPFAVGDRPLWPVVADLDGDGWMDVATAHDGSVSVLYGTTGGGFARTDYPGPEGGLRLTAADLTRDGRLDLAVVSPESDTVSILAGTAAGFAAPVAYATGEYPVAVAAADIDADGRADLVTTNAPGSVSVLRSEPGGTLAPHADRATAGGATGLLVRDLDADGRLEIATLTHSGSFVTVLGGQGGRVDQFFNAYLSGLAAGDVDGDGRLDLVSSGGDHNVLALLLGRAGGGFAAAPLLPTGIDARSYSTEVADVDGDGRPDVVTSHETQSGGFVRVLLNRSPVTGVKAPALSEGKADIGWSIEAFQAAVSRIDLQAQAPGGGWQRVARIDDPASSGTVAYRSPGVEGEYHFRALAFDRAGRELTVDHLAEATMRVVTTTSLSARMPTFEPLQVGTTGPAAAIRIVNTGEASLKLGPMTLTDPGFSVLANGCTAVVAPGEACEVRVRFEPRTAGPLSSELRFQANTATSEHILRLSGIGLPGEPPALTPSASTVPITPAPAPTPTADPEPLLSFSYHPGPKTTRLINFRLQHLLRGTTVTVRCARGCTRTTLTKHVATDSISLASFVKQRLKAGTTIRITVAAPGRPVVVATLKIRRRLAPTITTRSGTL